MEIFWDTIANYNASTWLAQIFIVFIGIVITILLYCKPTIAVKRAMKIYMVFVNGWIAIVYYMIFCSTRSYNYVLAIFWGIIALVWLWDLYSNYTTFEYNPKHRILIGVLYAMPFLYPIISWLRGMQFPIITSPLMPCSIAVFTIGLLLAFSKKVNLIVILFLCHWAIIAFSKVYTNKIPEDLLLAAATIPAIYLFFKNYFDQNLHANTKPSARFMNRFLATICIAIGIILTFTLYRQFTF